MADNRTDNKKPTPSIAERQIARVYAQALLDAAASAGKEELVVAELSSLKDDLLDPHPQFEALLASALINADEKLAILDRVFAGRASRELLAFLKVLAKHERLDCLRSIHSAAHDLFHRRRGKIPVEVVFASETSDALAEEIVSGLAKALGAEPMVTQRIDPSLIAGFLIRVADKVYDGSVRSAFRRAYESMVHQTTDLIQTERQRFLDSE